jgi:DNA-binding NarL/FixJ family response regulator
MTVRVLLADDQPLVRTALQMVITDAPDIEVVGEAGTGAEAIELAQSLDPDVVVMDIRMPGRDGIEATREITAGSGSTHVVVLTTFDDDDYVYGALRAGAAGFLVKVGAGFAWRSRTTGRVRRAGDRRSHTMSGS